MSTPDVLRPIGHDETLVQLKQLWAGGTGPRTLLFVGPASVGRRAAARWLAAYVNCAQPDQAPCGECESCQLMVQGTHPDLKEVLPATTTGTGRAKRTLEVRIDQLVVRDGKDREQEPLEPWLEHRPRYNIRVGVIDHADAMAAPAANSILKLLEEPPAWALIVLLAPGPELVLPTVASRSSTVRFKPVPADLMAGLPGAHADHPALVLGQPGLLLAGSAEQVPQGVSGTESAADAAAEHDPTAQESARKAASDLLAAASQDLQTLMKTAEEFASAQTDATAAGTEPTPLGWLRHELRAYDPTSYAAASEAVTRCEDALTHYAQAPLAATVLALELRGALR